MKPEDIQIGNIIIVKNNEGKDIVFGIVEERRVEDTMVVIKTRSREELIPFTIHLYIE